MNRYGFGIIIPGAGQVELDHRSVIDPEGTAAQRWRPLDTKD